MSAPLRVLFIDEGVLGHRTLTAQMREGLAHEPQVDAEFVTIPPPNRLERILLRRLRWLGDADMFELRWRLRWSLRARGLLRRRTRSLDVAVVNTQASALLMRGPMRRLPCVLSVDATVSQFRELDYEGAGRRRSRLQDLLLARLEHRAIAGAAAAIAWTEWNAEALRFENGSGVRVETIHPGLDAAWWGEAARRREAEHAGPMRVLFVGNDVERKGLDRLAAAVDRIAPDAALDVVSGDRVEPSDSLRIHRGVEARSERLRGLYAAADVFALPTRADAVPWSVLEAMAAGLPVIASRVGAIEEMLGAAGETVEPGSVDELEKALRRLQDPARRERLGRLALERVGERYDSAIEMSRMMEVLSEVGGRASTSGRGPLGMRRRTVVGLGLGAVGVAVLAPYAPLLADDEFEQLVASRLGIEPDLARQLLARAREQYGAAEYDARAAAFSFAVRDPLAALLPDAAREKAVSGLIEPMLSAPASILAYGVTGTDPGGLAPCAGLVRDR